MLVLYIYEYTRQYICVYSGDLINFRNLGRILKMKLYLLFCHDESLGKRNINCNFHHACLIGAIALYPVLESEALHWGYEIYRYYIYYIRLSLYSPICLEFKKVVNFPFVYIVCMIYIYGSELSPNSMYLTFTLIMLTSLFFSIYALACLFIVFILMFNHFHFYSLLF